MPENPNTATEANPYTAYLGTKVILAAPAKKGGEPGYEVCYPDGYRSWSPKAVFEEAYRPVSDGEDGLIRQRWPLPRKGGL